MVTYSLMLWIHNRCQNEKVLLPLPALIPGHKAARSRMPTDLISELYPKKSLPPIPGGEEETASNLEYYDPEQYEKQHPEERSRVPLIVQAQQQPGFNGTLEVSEHGTPRVLRPVLSTISEKTERTEPSTYWRNRQSSLATPRPLSSAPSSSYGEVIGEASYTFPLFNLCIISRTRRIAYR